MITKFTCYEEEYENENLDIWDVLEDSDFSNHTDEDDSLCLYNLMMSERDFL